MDHKKCIDLITSSHIPNVLVIGDYFIDEYVMCETKRLNPEAPVPLLNIKEIYKKLGGAGNVLTNLIGLGCKVSSLGVIGNDDVGYMVEHKLKDFCDDYIILKHTGITPIKSRYFSGHQQLLRVDNEESVKLTEEQTEKILNKLRNLLKKKKFDLIILSDYNKGTAGNQEITNQYISICKSFNIPVYVDPKVDFSHYRGCDLIKPNKREMEEFYSSFDIERLKKEYNIKNVIVTMGELGFNLDDTMIKSEKVQVYDVCGAGDVIMAVYAYCKCKGFDNLDAAQLSNKMAGLSCKYIGTHSISLTELLCSLSSDNKIYEPNKLPEIKGVKIFVNGCFDILHPGHIELIKYAKSLSGKLIVAVNSDEYIAKNKGDNRPYFNKEQRMKTLESLSFVDYVTYFNEDTPEELMKIIKPDIYVVGSDHKVDVVNKYVKETVFFDKLNGYSSTKLFNVFRSNS